MTTAKLDVGVNLKIESNIIQTQPNHGNKNIFCEEDFNVKTKVTTTMTKKQVAN